MAERLNVAWVKPGSPEEAEWLKSEDLRPADPGVKEMVEELWMKWARYRVHMADLLDATALLVSYPAPLLIPGFSKVEDIDAPGPQAMLKKAAMLAESVVRVTADPFYAMMTASAIVRIVASEARRAEKRQEDTKDDVAEI